MPTPSMGHGLFPDSLKWACTIVSIVFNQVEALRGTLAHPRSEDMSTAELGPELGCWLFMGSPCCFHQEIGHLLQSPPAGR